MDSNPKKIVLRKQNLKSIDKAAEVATAITSGTCESVTEIDLSHNSISNLSPLAAFINLQQLILDYNQLKYLDSMPHLLSLRVLSMSYNQIGNDT